MITILEGPDGAGKTRLAKLLSGPESIKHHGPYLQEDAIAWLYLHSMMEYVEQGWAQRVLDRSWISEFVYGPVYRGGSLRMARWHTRMLARVALSHEGIVIMCLPDLDICMKSWRERQTNEYLDKEEQLVEVWYRYRDLIDTFNDLPVIEFDYVHDDLLTIITRATRRRPLPNGGLGIGEWRPGHVTLVIGGYNSYERQQETHPFVNIAGLQDSPGATMTLWFELLGVPERELYWIYHDNCTQGTVEKLNPVRIITVGPEAENWMNTFLPEYPKHKLVHLATHSTDTRVIFLHDSYTKLLMAFGGAS